VLAIEECDDVLGSGSESRRMLGLLVEVFETIRQGMVLDRMRPRRAWRGVTCSGRSATTQPVSTEQTINKVCNHERVSRHDRCQLAGDDWRLHHCVYAGRVLRFASEVAV
jgi:hypothetical protein